MRNTKIKHKLAAAFLAIGLALTGCSGNSSAQDGTSTPALGQNNVTNSEGAATEALQIGTGRIVEEDISPDALNENSRVYGFYTQPDGTLVVLQNDGDGVRRAHYSRDAGTTWQEYDSTAFYSFLEGREYNRYTNAVDENGDWWVGLQDDSGLRIYHLQNGEAREIPLTGWGLGNAADALLFSLTPVPGGMMAEVSSLSAERLSFGILGLDGAMKTNFTPNSYPSWAYNGGFVYCVLAGEPVAEVYDVTTGEMVQRVELQTPINATGGYMPRVFGAQGDGSLITMNTEGIHTVNADGGVGEDISTTRAFTYGWPGGQAQAILALQDSSIVANFYTGNRMRILRYRYDPEAPVYETTTLSVWALEDTTVLQAATHAFLKRNPDFEVDIEIGRNDENEAFGNDDIIRELNLRLIGGNPPDVLVLDGLNAASLIKAGALQDISDIVNKADFYDGIINSYLYEGANYAYPAMFLPPVLGVDMAEHARGQAAVMNLETLAELCKDTSAISLEGYDEIFNTLYNAYSPRIFPGGDSVDEAEVANFMAAIDTIAKGRGITNATSDVPYMSIINDRLLVSAQGFQNFRNGQAGANPTFGLGTPSYNFEIGGAYVQRGDVEMLALPGGGFVPLCTAAVPTDAAQPSAAKAFIAAMLEDEDVQRIGNDTLYGFAVKRGLLTTQFEETRQRFTDPDDPDINMKGDITAHDWEAFGDSFAAATITDVLLRQRVYSAVADMCEGKTSLEAATSEILQNTSLYFAERMA